MTYPRLIYWAIEAQQALFDMAVQGLRWLPNTRLRRRLTLLTLALTLRGLSLVIWAARRIGVKV